MLALTRSQCPPSLRNPADCMEEGTPRTRLSFSTAYEVLVAGEETAVELRGAALVPQWRPVRPRQPQALEVPLERVPGRHHEMEKQRVCMPTVVGRVLARASGGRGALGTCQEAQCDFLCHPLAGQMASPL